ncbi:MAG: hypothetical protein KGJ13_06980 [Patescibacteria group bacterium]|nr:hypothetical protein [Patescibacteria group bacterium]
MSFFEQLRKDGFTRRESEICELLVSGKPRKNIADDLKISIHTLDIFLAKIRAKLCVETTFQAGLALAKMGLEK